MSINTGILYIVATPIGNLGDMSYRAVSVLQKVDLIAAEDTRHSAKLLNHYAISTPSISFHEHNEQQRTTQILSRLEGGESVALISDAGTPLVSDPGYRLVTTTKAAGIRVSPIPGPCAAIAALSVSGLPTDRFVFEGFLPTKPTVRKHRLRQLQDELRTLVFYESSHRIGDTLRDLRDLYGGSRRAVVARELTKIHETVYQNSLNELCVWIAENAKHRRGEFVILVQGASAAQGATVEEYLQKVLSILLVEIPLKQAVRLAAAITQSPKNQVYALALSMKNADHS